MEKRLVACKSWLRLGKNEELLQSLEPAIYNISLSRWTNHNVVSILTGGSEPDETHHYTVHLRCLCPGIESIARR